MEKKFKVLRIIGTVWKIMAWIVLVLGVLSSFGVLLSSIFGGGLMRSFAEQQGYGLPVMGIVGGVVGLVGGLIVTLIQFLMFYAMGQLIYLLLAIEENTRMAAQAGDYAMPQQPSYNPPASAPTPPPPPPSA